MMESMTEQIVGYPVYDGGTSSCVAAIVEHIVQGSGMRWLGCLNPHSYATAAKTPAFASALREADWLIPDGVGIVLASRLRRGSIRERITGSDIFLGVNASLNARGQGRVFFLGSTPNTLREIRRRMAADYPLIEIVGTMSPPFKPEYTDAEVDEMVSAINQAAPDVLWVGMTAPKQETWIHRVGPRLNVKFAAAIGAVFDFYIGRVKRSSPFFRSVGLEWLPRLLQEPRRLWRRTFVSAPVFLRDMVLSAPKEMRRSSR
jgi:N-acetylglucosaminyldiphosphoundecaprenol N-acetyl-beta-D-mannosaminyltransferase